MKKKAKKESGAATRARVKKEMAKPRMAKSAREGEINPGAAAILAVSKEGDDPVADWERAGDTALCVRMAADYSDEAIHVAIGQVFRCGETLRQRRDRYTENRTHHVGTVPAV